MQGTTRSATLNAFVRRVAYATGTYPPMTGGQSILAREACTFRSTRCASDTDPVPDVKAGCIGTMHEARIVGCCRCWQQHAEVYKIRHRRLNRAVAFSERILISAARMKAAPVLRTSPKEDRSLGREHCISQSLAFHKDVNSPAARCNSRRPGPREFAANLCDCVVRLASQFGRLLESLQRSGGSGVRP